MIITKFDAKTFLNDYWQKKPCIIKQFVKDFADPIDENDLAGLAQEEEVDSRIVSLLDGKWQLSQGPFESFTEHCVGSWTLLAQGVDKYIDEVNQLTKQVDFLPFWRIDDVMVSYSNAGAGVGPHTDEYDVFIIQGKGRRRWQVGLPNNADVILPHPLLKQITRFEPCIDEVLQAGDAVYIPPKHPHNGVALEDCLNYSIGFRAPTNLEVLQGLLDESEGYEAEQARYADPNINALRNYNDKPECMSEREVQALKQSAIELINSAKGTSALMKYLSTQQLPAIETDEYSNEEVLGFILEGVELVKMPGVRAIYLEPNLSNLRTSDHFEFYIDGNDFCVDTALRPVMQTFLSLDTCNLMDEASALLNTKNTHQKQFVELISTLINKGYWGFNFNDYLYE